MEDSTAASQAIVFGSPVAVGHVRPLMPLARRLAERGYLVVWAISGDHDDPASRWKQPLEAVGVHFIDLDEVCPFTSTAASDTGALSVVRLLRRVSERANVVSSAAAEAIAAAVGERRIISGVYDFFALWAYTAMKSLDVERIHAVVSAFPSGLDEFEQAPVARDPFYQEQLAILRASGIGQFDTPPRIGFLPQDPALELLSFSSRVLCPQAPAYLRLLGVNVGALPETDALDAASEEHRALVRRLQAARAEGVPVLLLSMGTIALELSRRDGTDVLAFVRELYSTLASAALRSGAIVVASTTGSSAQELGIDEAALGPAARERVLVMPFVPQPLLFAHGVVDAMLTHGGANTFHEAVLAGVPLLVCPVFGDQLSVARSASALGIGVCVANPMNAALEGAIPVQRVADYFLPEMLAGGDNRWKRTAAELGVRIRRERGQDAAEALILGRESPTASSARR